MENWVIPCNMADYDIVRAFQTLKQLDWRQSTNVEVGSYVYIYVGAPISAIKFKCKAIEINKPESTIDDSEFAAKGEPDEDYGRYMCLELIEEYPDDLYPKNTILANGLKTTQGPSRVTETLEKFLSQNFKAKKYTVIQAIWIATALMACETYEKRPNVKKQDMYFRNSDIVKRAQSLTEDKIDNARVSWWCCADAKQHTHNYLRGDNKDDESLRRLSCLNEFPTDTMPLGLDIDDLFYMNGRKFTMENLILFVKEQYPGIIFPPANASPADEEYWPSLFVYDPGIDAATYEKLLVSACSHEQLDVLYYMYKMGGSATCKQIAAKYGNLYNHYLTNANNIAKNIARKTGCKLFKRENGSVQYWPVLFVGKDANDRAEGIFQWMLRTPLREAVKNLDERGVFKDMKTAAAFDHNMILYGPPGTGKTYYTTIYAVAIADNRPFAEVESEAKTDYKKVIDRFNALKKEERIAFTTFHQSYGYEEFIEGIKPIVDDSREDIGYTIEDGVFKAFCKTAEIPQSYQANDKNYVFIIDEINRGNISKIFGELITLVEETKRKGADEEMSAILPYSAEPFSVPNNVYILGTMNTADRSIALMDTALRRRFQFIEMMPKPQILHDIGAGTVTDHGQTLDVVKMLEIINMRIEYLYDREHTIGHAFFTKLKDQPTVEQLGSIFQKSVLPLLQEYFYEDYDKIQLVLGDNNKDEKLKFVKNSPVENDIFNGHIGDIAGLPESKYEIQTSAFTNLLSYKEIHKSL